MGMRRDIYLSRRPLAGFVAIGAAWATYFAQMPVIKAQVGASDGAYGLAILFASFGAFAAMWLAPACRALAGGLAIPLGIAVLAMGMFGAGLSVTLMALTVAMLFSSVGSGIVDVLINARVSEIEEESGRALMNLNHALYSFAYAGASLTTGALRQAGYGPVFIMALLVGLLVVLIWAARDAPPASIEDAPGDAPGLQVSLVIVAGLVVLAAFLAEAATEGWSALHLERTLGGSPAEGALGPALLGLTMGFGRLFGHGLVRVMTDTKLMLLACLVSAAGIGLAGMAPTVSVALLGYAIGGLGISVVVPLAMALIGRVVPARQRLAAISRASVIGYGAFFFGPPLMGLVAEGFGLRMAFVAVAGLLALTALVLIPSLARQATYGAGVSR